MPPTRNPDPLEAHEFLDHTEPLTDPTLAGAIAVRVEGDVVVRDFPGRTVVAEQVPFPAAANPTPGRALPHAPNRARSILTAIGGTVWIGAGRGVSPANGFPIPAGTSLIVFATCEVWACTDAVTLTASAVAVYTEHRDGP
jgi:hypothetical protein